MKKSSEIDVVNNMLEKFFESFQNNPFNYLYESDLQAYLYSLLDKGIDKTVKLKGEGKGLLDGHEFETSIVKTEYPSKMRFDIALIDDHEAPDFKSVVRSKYHNEIFWVLPVKTAIEIKYRQLGERLLDKINEAYADIDKIIKYMDETEKKEDIKGFSLYFVQYLTDADRKHLENIQDYGNDPVPENIGLYMITPDKVYNLRKYISRPNTG